jgi:energy-coupling factor transporter ATP-binding protein EcfA2
MELLWHLNADQGITVLMVTHEADMAAYARRIVRFVDGVVESDERNPHPVGLQPGHVRGHGSGLTMWLNTLLLALRSIRRNLMRSFLTILGIVIGVSAVITMVTVGNGATGGAEPDRGPGHQPVAGAPGPAHGSGQRRFQRALLQGQRRRGHRHPDRRRRGRCAPIALGGTLVANGRNWTSTSPAAPTTGSPSATGPWPRAASSPTSNCAPVRPSA